MLPFNTCYKVSALFDKMTDLLHDVYQKTDLKKLPRKYSRWGKIKPITIKKIKLRQVFMPCFRTSTLHCRPGIP